MGAAHRFLATLDDLGTFLVVCGETVTVGPGADVPLEGSGATMQPVTFTVESSFHDGVSWRVWRGGERLGPFQGLELGGDPRALVHTPVAESSASSLLRLGRGLSAFGAHQVLLLVPEALGGAARIGAGGGALAVPREPGEEIVLAFDGEGSLEVRARVDGGGEEVQRVPLPLRERARLSAGRASARGPAFGIILEPVPEEDAPPEPSDSL